MPLCIAGMLRKTCYSPSAIYMAHSYTSSRPLTKNKFSYPVNNIDRARSCGAHVRVPNAFCTCSVRVSGYSARAHNTAYAVIAEPSHASY